MRYRIDQGARHCVALGLCACGQRFLGTDRAQALRRLAIHEAQAHPRDTNVRSKLHAKTPER